ncbi:MAG: acetate--CoA ligase family protein [Burkholderiales bacterium]
MIKTKSAPPALKSFFAPASAALVGASEDLTKFGGRLYKTMLAFGEGRPIYGVNPARSQLFGQPCYPSISALPEAPEHVAIVVSADKVLDVLQESAARGARYATVLSAGYAETGTEPGAALQRALVDCARRTGMRIMGPNCNGFINFVDGFAITNTAALRDGRKSAGNVGVVAHSGGLGQINVMWRAQEAGLGISYQVSCGNEADIDAIEFAQFMVEDESTDVVMMALEGVRSGPRFIMLAEEAARREKPLIVLKFGRTEAGQRAAASHTGAVTGADDVQDAAFRQFGVIRVSDCNELHELAKMLRVRRWPRGRRAAAMTGSGGHAVLMADIGASEKLEWPALSEETTAGLHKLLPSFTGVSNPMDLTSAQTGSPTLFTDALRLIARDANIDVLLPILVVTPMKNIDAIVALHESVDKPLAVLWTGFCSDDASMNVASLVQRGVPTYRDALTCVKAVRASIDYADFLRRFHERADREPPPGIDAERARTLVKQAGPVMTERQSKAVLAAYGLSVTRERLARSAAEAAEFAATLCGPVALKIESPDIPHKTEAGAIRLNVASPVDVRGCFDEVMAAARRYNPRARLDGVLVQEMVQPGIEVMLGVTRDPVFGPVITVAMGGIHVEVFRDVAHRIAPLTKQDVAEMLGELKMRPLLDGVRGAPPCDIAVLTNAVEYVSWLAHDLQDIVAELDINPFVVLPQGALVVDALIIKKT